MKRPTQSERLWARGKLGLDVGRAAHHDVDLRAFRISMTDFLVKRDDLRERRIAESEVAELGPGQVLLRVNSFGLTANNITSASRAGRLTGKSRTPSRDESRDTWGDGWRCPDTHWSQRAPADAAVAR